MIAIGLALLLEPENLQNNGSNIDPYLHKEGIKGHLRTLIITSRHNRHLPPEKPTPLDVDERLWLETTQAELQFRPDNNLRGQTV